MSFVDEAIEFLSRDSLFSAIITLYTILLIYSPSLLLQFVFSPVVFSTLILLLYLLRLGAANQNSSPERSGSNSAESNSGESLPPPQIEEFVDRDHKLASNTGVDPNHDPPRFYEESFVEWDVRAPLEVIYEEYDEEEQGNDVVSEAKKESDMNIIQRYASLSLFYPESDSDSSSDGDFPTNGGWDSPENMCFRWEDEDDRDGGLIEISLGEKRSGEVEEENLIEIDLFPAR